LTACPNCGTVGDSTFCPVCGQRQGPLVPTMSAWLREVANELFLVDRTLPRTLGALVAQPGVLTREWLQGHRTKYLQPLRIYLTVALVFFACWAIFGTPSESWYTNRLQFMINAYVDGFNAGSRQRQLTGFSLSSDALARINARLDLIIPLISIPVVAFASRMFIPELKRLLAGGFVFSLHIHAFALVLAVVIVSLKAIFGNVPGWFGFEDISIIIMVIYLTLAVRNAFAGSLRDSFGVALGIALITVFVDAIVILAVYAVVA